MKTIPLSLIVASMVLPLAAEVQSKKEPGREGFSRKGGEQRPFMDGWKAADSNQDGFISSAEFEAMPRLQNLPEEKRSNLFKRLDKDGDGKIGREELAQMGHPPDGKRPQPERLWELDVDRSGGVSLEEFKAGGLFSKLPVERQQEVFRRLDTNSDGQINGQDRPQKPWTRDGGKPFERRPGGLPMDGRQPGKTGSPPPGGEDREREPGDREPGRVGGPGPKVQAPNPLRMIREFDANGDGVLSFEEFRKSPPVMNLGEDDQEQRFNALDQNRDLKIGPDDLKDQGE